MSNFIKKAALLRRSAISRTQPETACWTPTSFSLSSLACSVARGFDFGRKLRQEGTQLRLAVHVAERHTHFIVRQMIVATVLSRRRSTLSVP